MKADCHNHSLFSPDSSRPPEEGSKAAVKAGFGYIAYTEHMDLGFPIDERHEGEFICNYLITDEYFRRIENTNRAVPATEVVARVEVG